MVMRSKKNYLFFVILFSFNAFSLDARFLIGKDDVYPIYTASSFQDIKKQIDDWAIPKEPPARSEWMKAEEYEKVLNEFNSGLTKDYIFYAIQIGLATCNSANTLLNLGCYDVDDEVFYINSVNDSTVDLGVDFLINETSTSSSRYNVDGASIDVYDVEIVNQEYESLNVEKINNNFYQVNVPYNFNYVRDNFYLFNLYALVRIPLNKSILTQDKILARDATLANPQEIIHNKEIINASFESYLLTHDVKIIENFGTTQGSEVKDGSMNVSEQINAENSSNDQEMIDSDVVPLFKIIPIYPRRARERGIMGYTSLLFDVNESGSVENVRVVEGYCSNKDPNDPRAELNSCTTFNSASERAALKLKYVPRKVNGRPVRAENISHKFTYILEN